MLITTSSDEVTVTGNVKSVAHFQEIKSTLDALKLSTSHMTIVLKDSISLTSSVIGYLNKLILKDKINVDMKIGSPDLMHLLEDLHLAKTFKARRL